MKHTLLIISTIIMLLSAPTHTKSGHQSMNAPTSHDLVHTLIYPSAHNEEPILSEASLSALRSHLAESIEQTAMSDETRTALHDILMLHSTQAHGTAVQMVVQFLQN